MGFIFALVLGISFLAFLFQSHWISKCRGVKNRRGLSGAEMARYLLDSTGFSDFAVAEKTGVRAGIKQLALEEVVYGGQSLFSLARAAENALALVRPAALFSLWGIFDFLIPAGWLALGANVLTGWPGFKIFAYTVFAASLGPALLELPARWEASHQVYQSLKQSGFFEVDELILLRRLLRALRFEHLSGIFSIPFARVSGFLKGGKSGI